MTALHGRLFATETPPSLTRPGFLGYSRGAGRAWNMFFVFGGRSRGDMHMGYKLSPMALAGLVRNALSLCDLFFFVWWHRTGEAKIWSSSWSWRTFSVFWWQDLLLDLDLCTSVCVCRHGQRQRWSVCFWFCSRPEAKASSHTCRRLKPCVVANHSSKHSFTSKTGCESTCFYRDVHTHVV